MGLKTLELTIISAKDLKDVNLIGKMDVYVAVELSGESKTKQKTPVHTDGGKNPSWNYTMRFTVEDTVGPKPKYLGFVLKHEQTFGADKELGEVLVPVKELLDSFAGKDANVPLFVTYQVKRSSGRAQGELKFSYKVLDLGSNAGYGSGSSQMSSYPPAQHPGAYPPGGYPPGAYPPPPQHMPGGYPSAYPPPHQGAPEGYPPPPQYGGGAYPPPHQEGYPSAPCAGGYPPPPQQGGGGYPQQTPLPAGYPSGVPYGGPPPPPPQGYPAYGGYPPQQQPGGYGYPPPGGYPPAQGGYPGYPGSGSQKPEKAKKNKNSGMGGMGLGAGLIGGAIGGLVLG